MKIDNNIAALYQSGFLAPQDQPRAQENRQNGQETLDAVREARRAAPTIDSQEYERLRARVEEQQQSGVVRDGLSAYAQNAISAYDSVGQVDDRSYVSQVLGVDIYV